MQKRHNNLKKQWYIHYVRVLHQTLPSNQAPCLLLRSLYISSTPLQETPLKSSDHIKSFYFFKFFFFYKGSIQRVLPILIICPGACNVSCVLVPEACPGEALNTQPLIHSPPSNPLFIQESESVRLALLESTRLAMFTRN